MTTQAATEAAVGRAFGVRDAELHALLAQGRAVWYPARKCLQSQGEAQDRVIVLLSGLLRCDIADAAGKESVDRLLYRPGEVVMDLSLAGGPAPVRLCAVEASTVFSLPLADFRVLLDRSEALRAGYHRLVRAALEHCWEEKLLLLRCTPLERYQWFLRTYPGLIHHVKHKDAASFLGMNPVTFSRVRRDCRSRTGDSAGLLDLPEP